MRDLNDASLKNEGALQAGAAGSHSEVGCNQKHNSLDCYFSPRLYLIDHQLPPAVQPTLRNSP